MLVAAVGLVVVPNPAHAAGGPVLLMGIDAEDGGPGAHGPIGVYQTVVNSIMSQTTNGGSGILVVGGGKSAGDNVTAFWNAIDAATPGAVTYVNGAAIATQSLAGFQVVAVASSYSETPGGGLTQAENDALAARQTDIANHVNAGGGLVGFSQTGFTNRYAYLGGVGTFTFNTNLSYSDITPTPAGTSVGITDALDVCCWHDEYATYPSFLTPLATNASTGRAAALGGGAVVIPTGITLTPGTAVNPVGTPHTVTAAVVDGQGQPFPAQLVAFAVTGANAGATGICAPASCQTDASGRVTFTYTGAAAGRDTITACFTAQGRQQCATATKDWVSVVKASINDVTVAEGDTGLTNATFTVSLDRPAPAGGVSVTATTADGTATAPADYVAQSGTVVTVAAGQTAAAFTVQVKGDLVDEPDENFLVNLGSPVGASIDDGQGVGVIVDDERDGTFTCRASALRLNGAEPAVANPANDPCADGARTVADARVSAGLVTVSSQTLDARTDQTPDVLEPTAPAPTDRGTATATVEKALVTAPGVTITATVVRSDAEVRCTATAAGLAPSLASSAGIASLRVNGVAVDVDATGVVQLPLNMGFVQVKRVVATPTSVTRQAIRIVLLGNEIVIGEARAGFTGNPCSE